MKKGKWPLLATLALLALACAGQGEPMVTWYPVEPMSGEPRLPTSVYPSAAAGGPVRVIAAQGEFEPASFVAVAAVDQAGVQVTVSPLRSGENSLPSEAVNVRVVKCWYQAGTAWASYFADNKGRVLIPELLLKDEALIKVDPATRDNYLRADYPDGSRYLWVSFPRHANTTTFNEDLEPVADSTQLRPVGLAANQAKQFWLTVKVPADAAPGVYTGAVSLTAAGALLAEIPLVLRVLPFALPRAKTNYDLSRDFYAILYNRDSLPRHLAKNGGDLPLAERKMRAIMENWRDHNAESPLVDGDRGKHPDLLRRQLTMMTEAGLRTRPVFGVIHSFAPYGYLTKGDNQTDHPDYLAYTKEVDGLVQLFEETLGHRDLYAMAWDEPGRGTLIGQRSSWRYVHDQGVAIAGTSKPWHFAWAAYNEDFSNYGGFAAMQHDSVRQWHAVGGRVGNYGGPHSGPENPDYIRRSHGMALYLRDFDATFNYIYYESGNHIWNDFIGEHQFRCFNFVYPTREGVIDTLAWEGYREAIDDVRYATLLQQLAWQAIGEGTVARRYAGKQALACLASADPATADLSALRLELIGQILRLLAPNGETQ